MRGSASPGPGRRPGRDCRKVKPRKREGSALSRGSRHASPYPASFFAGRLGGGAGRVELGHQFGKSVGNALLDYVIIHGAEIATDLVLHVTVKSGLVSAHGLGGLHVALTGGSTLHQRPKSRQRLPPRRLLLTVHVNSRNGQAVSPQRKIALICTQVNNQAS